MGIISALAGKAMVVARWKYQAIGSASASWMTVETNSNCEVPSKIQATVRTTRKVAATRPMTSCRALRKARISTRNAAARVGNETSYSGESIFLMALCRRIQSAPQDGDGDSCHGDHRDESELEAGLEQGPGIHQQDAQRSNAESVEAGAVAKEQSREQVDIQRDGGAHNGRAQIGDEGISPGQQNGKDGGPGLAEGQLAQEPEDREGENADVDAGDNQDVIRAGALEVGLDIASKESAAADQGCLHQRAAFARP